LVRASEKVFMEYGKMHNNDHRRIVAGFVAFWYLCIPLGAWLSPVEHLVRDEGVGGSNPLAPTE
jgi:hypothetical protein